MSAGLTVSAGLPEPAAARLGRFVAETGWADIPAGVQHQGRRALLNFFGCALGVAQDPAVAQAVAVWAPFSGPERLTVIGRPERLDAMAASFVNAVAANLLDYDDTHGPTVIHPAAPVAPAALALGEWHGLSGQAVLQAFVLGAEVECRVGLAVSPRHYARGWHITSTCGVFGSAAACSRLLGLSAEQTAAALGIAASQSAGIVENLATSAKNVGMGNAARNGLLAALFARAGFAGAPRALEGPLGWARAMGDVPDLSAMTGQLGERWEFASNTYKPYPSGIVFHAVIEACLALRERLGIADGAEVASVTVRGDQLLLDRGNRETRTERDARVSIAHNAAVALARGTAAVEDFAPTAVDDPALQRLRGRVQAELDASLPPAAAAVTVVLADGRRGEARVDAAKGSVDRPLSDSELEAKFGANAPGVLARQRMDAVWHLDAAPDTRTLMALMAQPAGRGLAG